jgi:dTDP-4-amino-4,6-dideoxygalactose transaminase
MNDEVIERETDSVAPSFSAFVHGPSFFPRVPLAQPSWNRETYRNILRCVTSRSIVDGTDLARLKSQIEECLGVSGALLCGSGSLALELALRACDVRRGDEVVLPTFCCSSVVPPILLLGATPVLADCGDELNLTAASVEAALTRKTKAVIVPHLFGNPAEIDGIIELVRHRNIRVIDDAAQALGATIDGQSVGSFGNAGIVSFGVEKVCFGLGGGALVSRRDEIMQETSQAILPAPAFAPAVANLWSIFIWRCLRRWTLPLRSALAPPAPAPDAMPAPYRQESMSNLPAAVASSLMRALDQNLSARRARVRAYRELLGSSARIDLISHRAGSACLTQVIRVLPNRCGDDAASRVITSLRAAGYEVQGSYVPIHLLSSFNACVWDRLPYAELLWPDLVELPCEPSVSLNDIERIAAIVKSTVSA